jgi:hypothetical protein
LPQDFHHALDDRDILMTITFDPQHHASLLIVVTASDADANKVSPLGSRSPSFPKTPRILIVDLMTVDGVSLLHHLQAR